MANIILAFPIFAAIPVLFAILGKMNQKHALNYLDSVKKLYKNYGKRTKYIKCQKLKAPLGNCLLVKCLMFTKMHKMIHLHCFCH